MLKVRTAAIVVSVKRIYILSGSILTGDYVADAIVDLAEVVAQKNSSATVDVPVLLETGKTGRATIVMGPASHLLAVPEAVNRRAERSWDTAAAMAAATQVRERIHTLRRTLTIRPILDTDRSTYMPDFGGL